MYSLSDSNLAQYMASVICCINILTRKKSLRLPRSRQPKVKTLPLPKKKLTLLTVKTQELVINTDNNSGKKKKGSSSKGPTTITISSMGDCTLELMKVLISPPALMPTTTNMAQTIS